MFLGNIANFFFDGVSVVVHDRLLVDQKLSLTNWVLPQELSNQGSLSCSGTTNNSNRLSFLDGPINA